MKCIFDLNRKLINNRTLSVGYSLGMVKIEAFDNSHFIHQTVRVCCTDHTDNIVSSIANCFDLTMNFLCNWKQIKNHTQSVGYSLGMVKTEAFHNSHFMHQTVRGCHTDHADSIVSSMACISDFFMQPETHQKSYLVSGLYNRLGTYMVWLKGIIIIIMINIIMMQTSKKYIHVNHTNVHTRKRNLSHNRMQH